MPNNNEKPGTNELFIARWIAKQYAAGARSLDLRDAVIEHALRDVVKRCGYGPRTVDGGGGDA